jgi:hypothetical protein
VGETKELELVFEWYGMGRWLEAYWYCKVIKN